MLRFIRMLALSFVAACAVTVPGCGSTTSSENASATSRGNSEAAGEKSSGSASSDASHAVADKSASVSAAFDYSAMTVKAKTDCLITATEIEQALSLEPGAVQSENRGHASCNYRWTVSEALPSWVSIVVYEHEFNFDKATKSLREGAELGIRYSENLAESDDYFMTADKMGKILVFARKGNMSLDINFRGGVGIRMNFKQATDQDIADRREEAIKVGHLLMRKYRT